MAKDILGRVEIIGENGKIYGYGSENMRAFGLDRDNKILAQDQNGIVYVFDQGRWNYVGG